MNAREAAIERMARAMCAWNGLTWEEARRPSNADGDTEAQEYASMAEDALQALLSPTPCSACAPDHPGMVWYTNSLGSKALKPCDSCEGSGHTKPAAVLWEDLDAALDEVASWYPEAVFTPPPWHGEPTRDAVAAESARHTVELVRAAIFRVSPRLADQEEQR